ncbi:MAG: MATE family efflux transporter [Propionibacteriales bacterium]|nr:MATE family efflux transporter [Propionibacteriales bacterium]
MDLVTSRARNRALDRELWALAIPAFATLVTEPLMVMADAAIVGHVSTVALAGLGIAANVLGIVAGLCVFLAYGTTATVARRFGAGDRRSAMAGGMDGLCLAGLIGVVVAVVLVLGAPMIIGWYPTTSEVAAEATTYLRITGAALPALLIMLASTGVLRGLQDTRTPLYVAIGVNLANIALNLLLVHGLGFGIAGAAIGTAVAQYAAAGFLCTKVIRGARHVGVRLRFHPGGVLSAARSGFWLMIRTASLQVSITTTTVVATGLGIVALAAHQIINALWMLLAMALDAIAIAAQAIIGRHLGAGSVVLVRRFTRRMLGWGVLAGMLFGATVLFTHELYAGLFTPDLAVQDQLDTVLIVVAVVTPISATVFVLDGVLIGAGDARYLALAGVVAAVAYLPLALVVQQRAAGLVWLWVAYGGYMIIRMVTLLVRSRTDAWLRTGA